MTEERRKFVVPPGAPERLDRFLHRELSWLSRNFFADRCREGLVLINGKKSAPGELVRGGETLELLFEPQRITARPELGAASLALLGPPLFEDEELLVIEKPRSIPSITLREDDSVTLADILSARDSRMLNAGEDPRESGLIQRLDTSSSGLIIAAKSRESWLALRWALNEGKIQKSYLALVEGMLVPAEQTVRLFLKAAGKRVSISATEQPEFQPTISTINPIWTDNRDCSIVEVRAPKAKRHQVRAHLAFLGHPLIGDELYGSTTQLPAEFGSGFLLHASKLRFAHPVTGEMLSFESSHPYFQQLPLRGQERPEQERTA